MKLREAMEELRLFGNCADCPEGFEEVVQTITDWWFSQVITDSDKGSTLCDNCNQPVFDYYMLRDDVWLAAWPTKSGLLHLECVEARLGRQLASDDFKDTPMNQQFRYLLSRRCIYKGNQG